MSMRFLWILFALPLLACGGEEGARPDPEPLCRPLLPLSDQPDPGSGFQFDPLEGQRFVGYLDPLVRREMVVAIDVAAGYRIEALSREGRRVRMGG